MTNPFLFAHLSKSLLKVSTLLFVTKFVNLRVMINSFGTSRNRTEPFLGIGAVFRVYFEGRLNVIVHFCSSSNSSSTGSSGESMLTTPAGERITIWSFRSNKTGPVIEIDSFDL